MTLNQIKIIIIFLISFTACSTDNTKDHNTQEKTTLPNILLIVADDMGYTDLGCFGSEISTPNIDNLAKDGSIFTNFYTAPMCAPCRASILTGVNNHLAGVGCQFHRLDSIWGYEGFLSDRIQTIPQVLKSANYKTFMTGKWHLGSAQDKWPSKKGFDQTFVVLEGAANHHNDWGFTSDKSNYSHNGKAVAWPQNGYSTDLYTNYALEFIQKATDAKLPFFGYLAYTSPHWPLQVDSAYWKKYEQIYSRGYEVLRAERLQNLKDIGFINHEYKLPGIHPSVKPWDELNQNQKKKESRKMALYAGMLENLDHHIGRIVKQLKDDSIYDNTMIIFMSDNGAASEDFYNKEGWEYVKETYNNDYENMGSPTSFVSYGPQWAEAGSAPYKYHKRYVFEGGIKAPLVIKPIKSRPALNSITSSFAAMTDLAETCYDLADIKNPNMIEQNLSESMPGKSILPCLEGLVKEIHSQDETWVMEHNHHVLVRRGAWKLVNLNFDWDEEQFVLYNLKTDPNETVNLKTKHPDVYKELLDEWLAFKKRYEVIRFEE